MPMNSKYISATVVVILTAFHLALFHNWARLLSSQGLAKTMNFSQIHDFIDRQFCSDQITDDCHFLERHIPRPDQVFDPKLIDDYKILRSSTILIVLLNRGSSAEATPLIYSSYASYFADIRFCGPDNPSEFYSIIAKYWSVDIGRSLSRLYSNFQGGRRPLYKNQGETIYMCLDLVFNAAQETPQNLTGFMVMHDDVILNHWLLGKQMPNLRNQSYIMPWMVMYNVDTLKSCGQQKLAFKPVDERRVINLENCTTKNPWMFYPKGYQKATRNFVDEWRHLANKRISPFHECYDGLMNITAKENRVIGGLVDFYYLTLDTVKMVLPLFRLAGKHQLFQEIAVQMIVHSCVRKGNNGSLGLIDDAGWSHYFQAGDKMKRLDIWDLYDANQQIFTHPLKLSQVVKALFSENVRRTKKNICLFCMALEYSKSIDNNVLTSADFTE